MSPQQIHNRSVYDTYRQFLAGDPRRRLDALEFGHDWHDDDGRCYRVCWYQLTGELTTEPLSTAEPLDVDDFTQGIIGPIQIIAHVPTRAQIDALLGSWPHTRGLHTLGQLHQLTREHQIARHIPA